MKGTVILALVAASLAACASSGWPSKSDSTVISNTPDQFMVVNSATGENETATGPACRNPMLDPGNGTRLTLVRSKKGFGDYQPDKPSYGLTGNQLLRINCSNGRPVGATGGER